MKHMLKTILSALCLGLLLCGCQQEKSTGGAAGSEYWITWPTVDMGTMEYEKLAVQPWNSGRCEATSNLSMAETENGYYLYCGEYLYYADKEDLSTWLPVCSKPNCIHNGMEACDAFYVDAEFIISGDRIYFDAYVPNYQEVYYNQAGGFALYSRALNGSDMRLEYVNEDMMLSDGGGVCGGILTAENWIYRIAKLNPDGSYTLMLSRVTKDGAEMLAEETLEDFGDTPLSLDNRKFSSLIKGEPSFDHVLLGDTPYTECRFKDGELYFTDLTDYYADGRYLVGNTLRIFRKNDGYYDVNLETKEEVRIGDAFLKYSESIMPIPNCIVESTLFFTAYNKLPKNAEHAMAVFDGESWRTVQLPKELLDGGKEEYLILKGVTSDSIFFTYQVKSYSAKVYLYRIPIQDGELHLEYCGRIK